MGDGTRENPYTREDVLRLIEKKGGKAKGLILRNRKFVDRIDLSDLDLSGVMFPRDAQLFHANFNGSNLDGANMLWANLQYSTFNPSESKATSLQNVDFRNAHLENAEFRKADLTSAQFQEEPEQSWESNRLLPAYLNNTDFRDANLFLANFMGCYFYGTKLEGAFIRGADIFDAHLEEADWGNYKIGEEIKDDFYSAQGMYRQLKQWYTDAGLYDIAGEFYYREREARRKLIKWFSRNWYSRLALQGSYLIFGHGERWKRILVWIAFFILAPMLACYFSGELDILTSLYFSVVSFTALGYGKWVNFIPQGWVQALGAFQSVIGIFLMALFLVTFVRKWAR